jgi:hypothetical protein
VPEARYSIAWGATPGFLQIKLPSACDMFRRRDDKGPQHYKLVHQPLIEVFAGDKSAKVTVTTLHALHSIWRK